MNACRLITAVLLLLSAATGALTSHMVSAMPRVSITPNCGPASPGFKIIINAHGFKPDSTVGWKFVGSDSTILFYGYFDTNSMGGFNDATFTHDLKPDHYKMYFGDDSDGDGKIDIGAKKVYQNVTIPC